ncbi:MAG: response regulator transcription factor [Lachnospiraceae bacterium]|nr:response regulator transcription factor [Lachnospiraceae bacterium]
MRNILLIEDDVSLSNGVKLALQSPDNTIIQCFSIKEARQVDTASVSLIVLDINLPDGNGLDYLQELKIRYNVPIILLTANDMETDIVTGLELGADDYITKPFSLAVLRARVNARIRSVENKEFVGYQSERFMFNFQEMMYMVSEEQIELSKTEQKLLRMLIENKGITLERGVLIDRIWTDGAEYVDENALSVVIKRLRDKIEEVPTKPQYIKTVYGIGYKWEE